MSHGVKTLEGDFHPASSLKSYHFNLFITYNRAGKDRISHIKTDTVYLIKKVRYDPDGGSFLKFKVHSYIIHNYVRW